MRPIHGYRFGVRIQQTMMGFTSIMGLGKTMEIETYHEGGRNQTALIFPKAIASTNTVTMKKGIYQGKEPPFYLIGESFDQLCIEVYDDSGKTIIKTYVLQQCITTKWEIGELNAMSNEIMIQTFEVAYADLQVVQTI